MRDYASRSHRPQKSKIPKAFWIVGLLFLALALTFPLANLYIKHKNAAASKTLTENQPKKAEVAAKKAPDNANQFEFYTLLPKLAVPKNQETESSDKH